MSSARKRSPSLMSRCTGMLSRPASSPYISDKSHHPRCHSMRQSTNSQRQKTILQNAIPSQEKSAQKGLSPGAWSIRQWKGQIFIERRNDEAENQQKWQENGGQAAVFVTKYCSMAKKVFRIAQKYWCKLRSAGISRYIENWSTLAYRSNQNPSIKLVRAKLKRLPNRRHRVRSNASNNSTHSGDDNSNSSSSNTSSICTSNTNSSIIPQNMDIARLAGIEHNVNLDLKVSTRRFSDHKCPLHSKLKCTDPARPNISKRACITWGVADCKPSMWCIWYSARGLVDSMSALLANQVEKAPSKDQARQRNQFFEWALQKGNLHGCK